jgi:hypothetical protein
VEGQRYQAPVAAQTGPVDTEVFPGHTIPQAVTAPAVKVTIQDELPPPKGHAGKPPQRDNKPVQPRRGHSPKVQDS